jgi:hypothetical protein
MMQLIFGAGNKKIPRSQKDRGIIKALRPLSSVWSGDEWCDGQQLCESFCDSWLSLPEASANSKKPCESVCDDKLTSEQSSGSRPCESVCDGTSTSEPRFCSRLCEPVCGESWPCEQWSCEQWSCEQRLYGPVCDGE